MSTTTSLPPLEDAEARRRIRDDLDATLIVEAAAGTGKTTTLISRVVELVRRGRTTLDRIVAVTFTDKAAGEMKLRLRSGLEQARAAAEGLEREHLDEAIRQLETARISTIHSLCADLLRERPIEAGVDPRFQVGADGAAERLFDQVFTSWYRDAVEGQADLPGVRRVLRLAASSGDESPRETLRKAGLDLAARRDYPAAWARPEYDRAETHAALVTEARQLFRMLQRASSPTDPLSRTLYPVADFLRDRERLEQVAPEQLDDDSTEATLRGLDKKLREATRFPKNGRGKFYAKELPRRSVVEARDAYIERLSAFTRLAEADIAASLQVELTPLVRAYQALKEKAGVLDFLDLLIRTRDLLVGDAEVRRELQERFDRVLIDEFQDTNPLQAEILLLLAADDPAESDWREVRPAPGKRFVVGDPKQSIYRFRRADVALYEAIKLRLAARGAEVLHLTSCFRLVPGIAGAVNAAFSEVMVANATRSQVDYVALSPVRPEPSDRPSVVGLPVPEPFSNSGNVTKAQIERSYPEAVGAFVAWLVHESGWTLDDKDGGRVPIAPQHVCLLFRRMVKSWANSPEERDLSRPYTRALEKRGVPHVLVGGHAFHQRPEVLALRNALAAIEWPDDELSVYATLRGPLFGVTDDMLLIYRRFSRLAPLEAVARAAGAEDAPALPDDPEARPVMEEIDEALVVLGELHRRRNRRPIADTITALLDRTRAHAGLAIWPTGEQALANALRVVGLARRFEGAGALSFRAFVDHLQAAAERGDSGDNTAIEEDVEGVRILTVHSAKGLEFPVVVLCDPTATAVSGRVHDHVDPERRMWAFTIAGCAPSDLTDNSDDARDRDADETVRLAYVAATRARDLLVAPVVADERPVGNAWLNPLHAALFPTDVVGQPAPGCPAFGAHGAALGWPYRIHDLEDRAPQPGLHAPRAGDHRLVWWDPRLLDLDVPEPDASRRHPFLAKSDRAAAKSAEASHAAWADARERTRVGAAAPTRPAAGFGALVAERPELGAADAPARVSLPPLRGRPRGARFGTLVHAVLADAPLGLPVDPTRVTALAGVHGAILGAPKGEVDAAAERVAAALGTELLSRAAASADCRRETPVALVLEDGTVAEGVIDLAFSEAAGDGARRWVVVDYKTGRDRDELSVDARRLRLYCDAVTRATGEPAEAVLLVL